MKFPICGKGKGTSVSAELKHVFVEEKVATGDC
jgi:hypothetical protein